MSGPADWPRDRWEQHPHWPGHTLLLESHDSFRGWSGWILERVRALDPGDASRFKHRRRKVPRLAHDFDWWMRGMKGHENYEERKLYPYLAKRWDTAFPELIEGHEELGKAKLAVFRAFETLVPGEPDEPVNHETLIESLERHRTVLFDHLELEENRVIPLLLELSPAEFRDYSTLPGPVLLDRLDR